MTLIERIVLESIQSGSKSVAKIIVNTDLTQNIVDKSVQNLLQKSLVHYEDGSLVVNKKGFSKFAISYDYQMEKRYEVRNIVDSCIKHYFDEKMGIRNTNENLEHKTKLSLKKVWMTEEEEKIYNSLIFNLNHFLSKLGESKSKKPRFIKNKKIIYFGSCDYNHIIDEQFKIPASF